MRRALLMVALVAAVRLSATTCITVSWTARDFFTATTAAARAVGVTSDTLRITAKFHGEIVRNGDVIQVFPSTCSEVTPGVEYFVATRCPSGSGCGWGWTAVAGKKGYEEYARDRHLVTRAEIMEKLRAWRARKMSTEELQRWLSSADASDAADGPADSLTLAVVERVEELLAFAVQAAACNPADATWLREHGSEIYLRHISRLPKYENRAAYEEWLEEQEDAEDEWESERLEDALERSLESARSWDHAIHCFLSGQGEGAP
jgi:hypothetical protein